MEKDVYTETDLYRCRRCGTCCRKGGPGLHLEDRALVDSGKIPLSHLLTFRQGEPVYDNVSDRIAPAVTDIIRIKSLHDGLSDCLYYDPAEKGCRIYHQRPCECDALQCWDTRKIEAVYNCRRLTRRHLLCDVAGLWDLVAHHQERCDYAHIAELAERIRQRRQAEAAEKELLELVRFDGHLRDLTLERGHLDSGMLEFLFGRPLSFTIGLFQLRMAKTDSGFRIEHSGERVCYRRNPAVH
jgi:Fe-S-cluster containining protein